ncbi:MAG TPA: DUF6524 family protein [Kiloniellales bacterium]|jgi:uncharacterized integral membrane protein|nr:DUF6524 family protein [Kiloniellales bacterium]
MARLSRFSNINVPALFCRRLLLSCFVVFALYNPSERSYWHWVTESPGGLSSLQAMCGILLVTALIAMVRMAVAAMRVRGVIAVIGLCFASVLLRVGVGIQQFDEIQLTTSAVQGMICLILALGMTWSHAQVRFSGERDVLHNPP